MTEVDPIESPEDIRALYDFLVKHDHEKEARLLAIGCNLNLRISDLLSLKFEQFSSKSADIKEIKTGKGKVLTFNNTVLKHVNGLKKFYADKGLQVVYLFQSTSRNMMNKPAKPISRSWVNAKFTEASEAMELDYNVGSHSMRKTWGFNAYNSGTDIHTIQKSLNHSSAHTTLSYIGITKRKISQLYIDNEIVI